MSLLEASWVIARRDFVAQVYSRSFILFLIAPLLLFAFSFSVGNMAESVERSANQPVVALVTDTPTADVLNASRRRLVEATSELSFPSFIYVAPAENVRLQARRLLADDDQSYSAVVSGTLDRPVLTGPERVDASLGGRIQLVIEEARRSAAIETARVPVRGEPIARDVTEQAAGNLQMVRRLIAQGGQVLIFIVTLMLATLLLSTLVEEKSNKVIEVLAAAVPLDAVFLGKLLAMLGISLVGLALWAGMLALGYAFFQVVQDWAWLPEVAPAIGWPIWIALLFLYYAANFMLLGALFLGIGGQASNIREIQTISMPVTLLQLMVLLLAMTAVGRDGGAVAWIAYIVPFSSPLVMVSHAAQNEALWPHLVALAWQALWIVLIIRLSARLFRQTVLKSTPGGSFFDFLRPGRRKTEAA